MYGLKVVNFFLFFILCGFYVCPEEEHCYFEIAHLFQSFPSQMFIFFRCRLSPKHHLCLRSPLHFFSFRTRPSNVCGCRMWTLASFWIQMHIIANSLPLWHVGQLETGLFPPCPFWAICGSFLNNFGPAPQFLSSTAAKVVSLCLSFFPLDAVQEVWFISPAPFQVPPIDVVPQFSSISAVFFVIPAANPHPKFYKANTAAFRPAQDQFFLPYTRALMDSWREPFCPAFHKKNVDNFFHSQNLSSRHFSIHWKGRLEQTRNGRSLKDSRSAQATKSSELEEIRPTRRDTKDLEVVLALPFSG